MLIAQLSDLHLTPPGALLYGYIDTKEAFLRALARLTEFPQHPDALILTGDLSDGGDVVTYEQLAEWIGALPFPAYVLPGNHDLRDNLRQVFPGQSFSENGLCCQKVSLEGRSMLLLDVQVPGHAWGEVGDSQIEWLDSAIGEEPTLLFMHHPPFETGIAGMDSINCRGGKRLADWLLRHPNVLSTYCGHVHRFAVASFAGRPAMTAPAPAHQIALDFSGREDNLACTFEPGGLLMHYWPRACATDQAPVSHYLPLDISPIVYFYR